MLPINDQLAELLSSLVTAPTAYIWAQVPTITNAKRNTIDYTHLGSQYIIKNALSVTRNDVLDIGANSLDFVVDNTQGIYSPLNNSQAFSKYFQTGLADLTYQLFLGQYNNGAETIIAKGVFLSEGVSQDVLSGANTLTLSALDQFSLFTGDVYTSFPPRLYGQQLSSYYNPNYALTNPSGDGKTWVADVRNWMTSTTQSVLWASDFVTPAVYLSNMAPAISGNINTSEQGMTPLPASGTAIDGSSGVGNCYIWTSSSTKLASQTYTYSIDYINGVVTFTTPLVQYNGAYPTVSVDCRPLSMAPELALYHLFVDFGSWNPTFLKFDNTGIQIPLVELSRDRTMLDVATDIVSMTAVRGVRWRLWIDEVGYIRFNESATDHTPVKYLIDTRDILRLNVQQDTRNMYNVVRANAISVNNQPLTSISYDVTSINIYGQKPTYDVPSQFLNITKGMDPGTGISYLNGMTNSLLFEYSRPLVTMEIQVLPDISIQVGDILNITETTTGIANNWLVKQINDEINGEHDTWTQNYYIEKVQYTQDYNYGIQSNIGAPFPTNANAIQAQSGFIQDVSFSDSTTTSPVFIVSNGNPSYDSSFNPVVYEWDGSPLNISITIGPPSGQGFNGKAWIWRWMYIGADAYCPAGVVTGSGTMIGMPWFGSSWAQDINGQFSGLGNLATYPYDVRADTEPITGLATPLARRYWRPLLICSDWWTNDGITSYQYSTGTPTFTFNSTWSNGVAPIIINPTQPAVFYGNLRVGINDYFSNVSSNFRGQQLYATGSAGASYLGTSSSIKYGVDYGLTTFTGGSSINLVPDSQFQHTSGGVWTLSGAMIDAGSSVKSPDGTGVAKGGSFSVTAGNTYTFSGYINSSNVPVGSSSFPVWTLHNAATDGILETLTAEPKSTERYHVTFTMPAGVTSCYVKANANGATNTSGNIVFKQPQVNAGTGYGYVSSSYFSGGIWYGINNVQTPCFLQILVATDFGTFQLKTIPFQLNLGKITNKWGQ